MEDALAHVIFIYLIMLACVLILVVMEDALAHFNSITVNKQVSLNPCCNGRCTRTFYQKRI